MSNNSDDNTYMNFIPPKLPFAWLATSFIAPVVIAVLPSIISRKEISMEMQIIIGLTSLSIMLFVSCIMLTLKLYNTSYSQQLIELKISMLEQKSDKLLADQETELQQLTKQLDDMMNLRATLAKQYDDLFRITKPLQWLLKK